MLDKKCTECKKGDLIHVVFFWVMTSYNMVGDQEVSMGYITSIFKVNVVTELEDMSFHKRR